MHNGAFDEQMDRWGRLSRGVAEHASDALFLKADHQTLIQAQADAWEAKQRQLRHRAAAQQATRDLEAAVARAQDAATRLQCGLLGKYGATNPMLIAFGMSPRRGVKPSGYDAALEALKTRSSTAVMAGGAPPRHAEAAPPARGTAPQAEAKAPRAGGSVPQAEAGAAAISRAPREGGGEAPQAEKEVAARGGTAPPAVEAVRTMRIVPIWMRIPPVGDRNGQPRGFPLVHDRESSSGPRAS